MKQWQVRCAVTGAVCGSSRHAWLVMVFPRSFHPARDVLEGPLRPSVRVVATNSASSRTCGPNRPLRSVVTRTYVASCWRTSWASNKMIRARRARAGGVMPEYLMSIAHASSCTTQEMSHTVHSRPTAQPRHQRWPGMRPIGHVEIETRAAETGTHSSACDPKRISASIPGSANLLDAPRVRVVEAEKCSLCG